MNNKILWEKQTIDTNQKSVNFEDNDEDKLGVPTIQDTPLGLYRIEDTFHPYKIMDVYIGHTNFDITKEIMLLINMIGGVNCLRVLSRYNFVIGIGKAFNSTEVLQNIENILTTKTQYTPQLLLDVKNNLVKKMKKSSSWYNLVVFPDGSFITNTDKEKAEKIHTIYELTGGAYAESIRE